MTGIPGSPPDLRLLPAGCVFHPRCGFAVARCVEASPPLEPLEGNGRIVACWRQHGPEAAPDELARPEPAAAMNQAASHSGSAA
jgi:peptide/nickel transport system ATP-binding protein